jgi:hypothetical protein
MDDQTILIVRILHERMDLKNKLKKWAPPYTYRRIQNMPRKIYSVSEMLKL